MDPIPAARYQVGIALNPDRVAVLADAGRFALAQAHQIVITQLLRGGAWPVVVVIVRLNDSAVLDWQLVPNVDSA